MKKEIIEYKRVLEDTLKFWPQIIFCDDMKLIEGFGVRIPYLDTFYFRLEDKLNVNIGYLRSILSWSVKIVVSLEAIKVYEKEDFCKYINLNDIDYEKVKEYFINQMSEEKNIERFKRDNIEIIYV
ncbi:MAG: Unknown protein [uncultured Campylobacterales bacterium]|uniref:Uncharacterized protein n=1 Tax=uncultured Campylobacterales bacterium TaxID=352960 RepID=A0A6S6SUI8_9BACT|nr:MAG: Unknown protein [uncultured Campylobacterales bacterium]